MHQSLLFFLLLFVCSHQSLLLETSVAMVTLLVLLLLALLRTSLVMISNPVPVATTPHHGLTNSTVMGMVLQAHSTHVDHTALVTSSLAKNCSIHCTHLCHTTDTIHLQSCLGEVNPTNGIHLPIHIH